MTPDDDLNPRWKTSSSGRAADTSPMELSTLVTQLADCKRMPGRLFALRCFADTLHGFLVAHFVTSLVVVHSWLARPSWRFRRWHTPPCSVGRTFRRAAFPKATAPGWQQPSGHP